MNIPMMHDELTGLPDGLYVGFFHGRDNPDQYMEDWGYAGPLIGPLKWWHTTYDCNTRAELVEPSTQAERELLEAYIKAGLVEDMSYTSNGAYCPAGEFTLDLNNDCAVVGGKYYGDWSVFYVKNGEVA